MLGVQLLAHCIAGAADGMVLFYGFLAQASMPQMHTWGAQRPLGCRYSVPPHRSFCPRASHLPGCGSEAECGAVAQPAGLPGGRTVARARGGGRLHVHGMWRDLLKTARWANGGFSWGWQRQREGCRLRHLLDCQACVWQLAVRADLCMCMRCGPPP